MIVAWCVHESRCSHRMPACATRRYAHCSGTASRLRQALLSQLGNAGRGAQARPWQFYIALDAQPGARHDPPSSTRATALVSMRSGGRLPRHQAAMLSTIFPRLCGAPPSISWALRASSSGSTVPTFVTNFPLSNSSETSFSRAVVTST